MANKLPCEIVQDLLPSYMDGLTNEVTNQAVEEHVKTCDSCRDTLYAMKTPVEPVEEQEEKHEIDFLKKAKRKHKYVILGSIMVAIVIIAVVIFTRFYVVGSSLYGESVMCTVDVNNGNEIVVTGKVTDSGIGVSNVRFEEEDGVVTIHIMGALASPFNEGVFVEGYNARSDVDQVRVGERIVWDRGLDITPYVSSVYNTKHSYVGDASANTETANALGIGQTLGAFTNELQTTEEPYGWTLIFEEDFSSAQQRESERQMKKYAIVLMALIENLGEVIFEYTVDGVPTTYKVTEWDAKNHLGEYHIKPYGENPSNLQILMESLGLLNYSDLRVYSGKQNIELNILNGARDVVSMVTLDYYVDNKLVGSVGCEVADGSPFPYSETMSFVLLPKDFSDISLTSETELYAIITVYDESGNEYTAENRIDMQPEFGYEYDFVLVGNTEDGYRIEY